MTIGAVLVSSVVAGVLVLFGHVLGRRAGWDQCLGEIERDPFLRREVLERLAGLEGARLELRE